MAVAHDLACRTNAVYSIVDHSIGARNTVAIQKEIPVARTVGTGIVSTDSEARLANALGSIKLLANTAGAADLSNGVGNLVVGADSTNIGAGVSQALVTLAFSVHEDLVGTTS